MSVIRHLKNLTHDTRKPFSQILNTHAVVINAGAGLREWAESSHTGSEEKSAHQRQEIR